MNRGYFDAPDTDVHFGGIAIGGMPNRARCSCGAGRRRRKRGRRDEARCRLNQGRKRGHTSRLDKLCWSEHRGLSHRGRCRILIRSFGHCVCRAQLFACVICRLREYRGHGGIVSAWKRDGGLHLELSRFGERRRGSRIARRLLEYRGHGGIREPGRGFRGHAQPERLSRKAAQITTHAITMPRYAERRCSPSASTSRSLQP